MYKHLKNEGYIPYIPLPTKKRAEQSFYEEDKKMVKNATIFYSLYISPIESTTS
jgi:hypothetical protein